MKEFFAGQFDIAVIGAGHAGIEAALAAARMGLETVCLTMNLDAVGNMPCNPAIGGTGKGHLVRELDALGGEMARGADAACIQYRMLNRGKGPAVHSLRAQADRRKYQQVMKHTLERQEHLTLRQGEVVALRTEDGSVRQVVLRTGAVYGVRSVILCSGTYLHGRTIVGECVESSGPDGLHPSGELADCLTAMGLPLRRFKTGTPPRINARTVDFDRMEVQTGDDVPVPFSFSTTQPPENRAVCWLTYTNEETHRIIRENLDRSPIYTGVIEGVGPRYCPSIETKIVRFPDKPRHQLFVEPMGLDTEELYLQGFSSSLPEEVQVQMLHTVPGLETRPFPGGWLLTGAPLCGGRSFALLERFFRQTAELVTGTPCPSAYPAMLRALEAPMPDDVPQFRTTFAGTRQDPAERAVLSGLDEENFAPVPLLHALLRGMADELSACYRAALKAGCAPAGRLLGSGNGLRRNPALQRAVERSFGLPLTLAAVPEEAACGAALFARMQHEAAL